MRLPRFLEFLRPKLCLEEQDQLKFKGHLRVERQVRGGPLELVHDGKNFIVDVGITAVRDVLVGPNGGGFTGSIFRMAVGDGGVPVGELFNPKIPDGTWPARTGLYHEILRQDISVFSSPTPASMRFVGAFNTTDVDPTSYSLIDKVINEASLIIGDGVLTVGGDKKQINKAPPDTVGADEKVLSVRTFNSASFDSTEDVTITITWGLTIIT